MNQGAALVAMNYGLERPSTGREQKYTFRPNGERARKRTAPIVQAFLARAVVGVSMLR